MKKIYIADDEEHIRCLIQSFLTNEGYDTEIFPDGTSLYKRFGECEPDMIILDIMMPGIDGLNLCAAIRQESRVPIIIVSAKDSPLDRVNGISLGSDDYLVKPFLPLELIARVKALFRRADMANQALSDYTSQLSYYDICLDKTLHSVTVGKGTFGASPTEYAFLQYMLERRGTAVSKKELIREVWKTPEYDINARLADDMVKRLRKKLKEAESCVMVETVWGFGFRLSALEKEDDI